MNSCLLFKFLTIEKYTKKMVQMYDRNTKYQSNNNNELICQQERNSLHTSQSQIFSSLKILKLYRSEFPEWSVRWRAASEPETFCTRESKQKLCGTSMHKNDNFMFHNDIKDSVAILLYIPIDCTTH